MKRGMLWCQEGVKRAMISIVICRHVIMCTLYNLISGQSSTKYINGEVRI